MHVDHINGNGLDNRRTNLRPATSAENARNRRSQRGSSSPYKGVSWIRSRRNWRANLRVGDRLIHLGSYTDPADAARAYDAAALKYFGEFARLNFPEDPR
jgi:AP2 domain/HNH endonuclease